MDYKTELGFWVVASLLLSIGSSWLAWRFQRMQSRSADWLRRRLLQDISGRILVQAVRFLYYVGLPYAALLRRALSLVAIGALASEVVSPTWWTLGWSAEEWARALGWGASLGAMAALLLALGWRNAARAQGQALVARGLWPAPPWWGAAREVLYAQVHWAFYRAAPLLIIGDAYWAALSSAAFPLLEWMLNPDWWAQLRGGPRREQVLMQCVWLAVSTVYFALARNVWLVIALHLILALALNRWLAVLAGNQNQAQDAAAA